MAVTQLFDLTGHVAVITGGNSGIGLGMADALAASGAAVAIWGTNADKNAAAAKQLREAFQTPRPAACMTDVVVRDLSDYDTAFGVDIEVAS